MSPTWGFKVKGGERCIGHGPPKQWDQDALNRLETDSRNSREVIKKLAKITGMEGERVKEESKVVRKRTHTASSS